MDKIHSITASDMLAAKSQLGKKGGEILISKVHFTKSAYI